ncbi:MAG: hypothetical protein KGZ92_01210 [Firmicutes bacterium]|nr:hypothetical protein [Dethiobacter sp.]MBS3887904.1 hypothetical protein [Bacillota bacterium]MBS4053851.1 hypothetical protein [Thermaerobacter sp.]MBS4054256.1 hypothetical protein [Thermaerobacter sp.]
MKLVPGNIFGFWTMLFVSICILLIVKLAKDGKFVVKLRRIAGLEAIEEAIGRATEMGKPVHFSPGIADVTGDTAPQTFAALEVLGYVTGLSAKYNAELIVSIRIPNVFPLAQEVVRQGYMAAGKTDLFKEDTVRFLSSEQFAYIAGVLGIFARQRVAANLMIGAFWAESLLMAEGGAQVGAIQVAGTANMHQIPFFVAACDYTLIGEEIYAGGAYLSQDKVRLGSIASQDYIKLALMAVIFVGAVMMTAGNDWLRVLLVK